MNEFIPKTTERSSKMMTIVRIWVCVAVFLFSIIFPRAQVVVADVLPGDRTAMLDFEGLESNSFINDYYLSEGVSFVGAIAMVGDDVSPNYPPYSGESVLVDLNGSIITYFQEDFGEVKRVGVYISTWANVLMEAFDRDYNTISFRWLHGPNLLGFEPGPNEYLEIVSTVPIYGVKFTAYNEDNEISHIKGNYSLDDFTYTSYEGCELDVPFYAQVDPNWKDDRYGDYYWESGKQDETINNWGCALTSAAMLLSYYAQVNDIGVVNPAELNKWLRARGGYNGGLISFTKVAEYAQDILGLSLFYNGRGYSRASVEGYICGNIPVILEVQNKWGTHFVTAYGNRKGIFQLNDPLGEHNTLKDNYDGVFTSSRHFSPIEREVDSVLEILATKTISIRLIDPNGKSIGLDSVTGVVHDEIEGAILVKEALAPNYPDVSPSAINDNGYYGYRLEIKSPLVGDYEMILTGVEDSDYMVSFYMQKNRIFAYSKIEDQTAINHVTTVKFSLNNIDENPSEDLISDITYSGEVIMPNMQTFLPLVFG